MLRIINTAACVDQPFHNNSRSYDSKLAFFSTFLYVHNKKIANSMSFKFNSDGFDLDALGGKAEDNVVYEIGGGVTIDSPSETSIAEDDKPLSPLEEAEYWKGRGNEEYNNRNFLEAYDLYTEAIAICPFPFNGDEIIRQRDEYHATEQEKARQRMDEETKRGRSRISQSSSAENDELSDVNNEATENRRRYDKPSVFALPRHENYDKLSVYYCNRAAAAMQMERYDDAITDADIAILLDPSYTKAFVRRSAAYEKTERTEEALKDAKKALELDPSNITIRKSVARLQKVEDERMEKLKVGVRVRQSSLKCG